MELLVLMALLGLLIRVDGVLEHDDIRLVNLPNGQLCEGRLEVYHYDEFARGWFAVCDRSLDKEELRVICRQIGCPYSSSSRTDVARYGEWSGHMKALRKDCSGYESDYSLCPTRADYRCDFQKSDLVGVVCSKGHWIQAWLSLTMTLSLIPILAHLY